MKKLIIIAAALTLGACSQFEEFDAAPSCTVEAPTTIEASIEKPQSDTRTYVDNENMLHWTAGDQISYFPGIAANVQYRFKGETGATGGSFEKLTSDAVTGTELNCNYAVYPYNEATSAASDGKLTVSFPATQSYAENSFGPGANLMVAATKDKNDTVLRFKNACGYLKLQLYGNNAKVKSITLKGNKDEKIAGAATISTKYEDTPKVTMANEALTAVTLDCSAGEGVTLSSDSTNPTAFWFAIPETTFSEGFSITVTGVDGGTFTQSTSKSITIERNMIQPMAAFKATLAGEGIDVVNNKVRFYISEKSASTRTATALAKRDWSTSSVMVNGTSYAIQSPTQNPYVDVAVAEDNIYAALLETPNSSNYYGSSNVYTNIKLPYSQFQNTMENIITSFPMYASYSPANGNKLIFNDGFALVNLKLKGTAKITSVRIENPAEEMIAGISTADKATGAFSVVKGMDFAALNCTNQGNFVTLNSSSATNFYVMLAPGNYTQGLKVSICDTDHRAVFHNIPAINLEAGQVYTIEKTYSPDADLIFYDGFDNFVWGGDWRKGMSGKGYAPNANSITVSSSTNRTGYEEAFTQVTYTTAGSAFIQSNTWSDVTGKTVGTSHLESSSYVTSRNIADYGYLFRVQERPGYIAVGAGNNGRGIVRLPMLSNIKSIGTIKVTVKFLVQNNYTSDGTFETNVIYGGVIKEAYLNGSKLADNITTYESETAKNIIPRNQLTIPTNASVYKEWNTLEIVIDGATNGTTIHLTDTSMVGSQTHGIYIDSIEVRELENCWEKSSTTLRVLMWNIQNGMITDQHNNYNNFVEWVKKWDPDVCIWCESETIYKDKSGTTQNGTRYLPNGWSELCKRYGHSYAYTGGDRDNYSQTVTSKYKITNINRITSGSISTKPITHGAGHCSITVNGKKINIVACHMWPQQWCYTVNSGTTAKKEESSAKNEGDYYREYEMKYIVDNTVNKSSYESETYWLLGGDTNSKSPKDQWYYGSSVADVKYLPHKYIIENTTLKDVIADKYPSGTYFMTSTYGKNRIDILYASPAMFDRITNSIMLMDEWTSMLPTWSYYTSFHDSSDHRPVLVDFDMK